MKNVTLGRQYQDIVTGFNGTAVAESIYSGRSESLVLIERMKTTGDGIVSEWVGSERLEPVKTTEAAPAA